MKKASLIAQIQLERQKLEHTLVRLSPEQWESPGAVGNWSVKDTLAHIAAWQQRLTDWLLAYSVSADQQRPPYGLDDELLIRLNDQIYQDQRGKTCAEVRNDFRSTYQKSLQVIEDMPQESLKQPITYQGQAGPQVWEIIAANTCEHDQEHHHDIVIWLTPGKAKEVPFMEI